MIDMALFGSIPCVHVWYHMRVVGGMCRQSDQAVVTFVLILYCLIGMNV